MSSLVSLLLRTFILLNQGPPLITLLSLITSLGVPSGNATTLGVVRASTCEFEGTQTFIP